MNIGKLFGKAVNAVKRNPQIALAIVGLFAPKLVAKAAPVIVAAITPKDEA